MNEIIFIEWNRNYVYCEFSGKKTVNTDYEWKNC